MKNTNIESENNKTWNGKKKYHKPRKSNMGRLGGKTQGNNFGVPDNPATPTLPLTLSAS